MAPPSPAPTSGSPPALEVAAGLVFRQGRLLLTQRRHGAHLGGLWEFPGGKREPGETYSQCLERELREELGIEARAGELLDEVEHAYPGQTVRIRFHRCRIVSGEPRPVGCEALVWAGPEDLDAYPFPAADARLLERLRSSPSLWRESEPDETARAGQTPGSGSGSP